MLAWQDLKKFDIAGTEVYFKKHHTLFAWKRCALGNIVNYEVFKRLVNAIQKGHL